MAKKSDDSTNPTMDALLALNPNKRVLEAIRDNPDSLDSDKIRATQELGKIEAAEKEKIQGGSDLRDLRAIIEALPEGERLAWLMKEKNETAKARGWNAQTERHEA